MFRFARHLSRQIGLACLLLLTLAVTVPAAEAQACAPSDVASSASTFQPSTASDDGCGDCALSCAHGCCHAAHVGILSGDAQPLTIAQRPAPVAWRHMAAEPPATIGGPERPPRA